MYTYVYIYIYTYIHVYIYIYIYSLSVPAEEELADLYRLRVDVDGGEVHARAVLREAGGQDTEAEADERHAPVPALISIICIIIIISIIVIIIVIIIVSIIIISSSSSSSSVVSLLSLLALLVVFVCLHFCSTASIRHMEISQGETGALDTLV